MGATLSSLCSTPIEMDTGDWKRFTYLTFCCRLCAIDILYKVKIGSASDADNTQWKQISDMIRKYDDKMSDKTLKELREELEKSRDPDRSADSSIVKRIKIVSDAFDTGLLRYLQAKVDLMKELGDWLPRQDQDWEKFVMARDEEDILDNLQDYYAHYDRQFILPDVEPSAGLEVLETFKNLTRMLMSPIEGVDEDAKENGVSQSVQKENKIKVFYATNRLWSDGSYTSEPGNCLLYGFQQVSIPGVHKRGKVESPNKSGRGNNSEHFMLEAKSGAWLESDEFLKQIKREFDSECAQNGHSANDAASSTGGPQKVRVHKQ
jgi:hypothetical protein